MNLTVCKGGKDKKIFPVLKGPKTNRKGDIQKMKTLEYHADYNELHL